MAMLNTSCPVYTFRKRIASHVVHMVKLGPKVYVKAVIKGIARRLNMSVPGSAGSDQSEHSAAVDPELQQVLESRYGRDEALVRTVRAIMHAEETYVLKERAYPGKITYFRALDAPTGFEDNRIGWRNFARGGFEAYDVPGTHVSMREEPRVVDLVEKLKPCLEKAQKV